MSNNPFSYSAIYTSPIGELGIQFLGNTLSQIKWLQPEQTYFNANDPIAYNVLQFLDDYFVEAKWNQNNSITLAGTEFQNKVWNALINIPCGSTISYGELAKELHTSSRAIGQACKRNRIPIIIPCHRVVAKSDIGGFFGKAEPSPIKHWLLNHECSLTT